jgi:hypothetical protein
MSLYPFVQEMADALAPLTTQIDGLQIYPGFNPNASPPSIDIYSPDPFQEGGGFGVASKRVWFTVRARVATTDWDGASQLLFKLLDPADAASVEAALAVNQLAVVDSINGSVSGFRKYTDDNGTDMIGCEWRVGAWTR